MNARESFCVEPNVPIPPQRGGRPKYPWKRMKVGESFLVPGQDKERVMNSLTSCRRSAQRTTGWRFTLRSTAYGVRVWRVA